jgi:hypothetical protein
VFVAMNLLGGWFAVLPKSVEDSAIPGRSLAYESDSGIEAWCRSLAYESDSGIEACLPGCVCGDESSRWLVCSVAEIRRRYSNSRPLPISTGNLEKASS